MKLMGKLEFIYRKSESEPESGRGKETIPFTPLISYLFALPLQRVVVILMAIVKQWLTTSHIVLSD